MSKIDFSVLKNYSESEIKEFNRRIESFLNDERANPEFKESIAYFYLTLHKMENEKDEKRRGLSLIEAHEVIRRLQGQILTLIEASIPDSNQQKALKDIINNHFSNAQSHAQDIDWGRYDYCDESNPKSI